MFFRRVSEMFVNTFGITQPDAAHEKRSGMIITVAIIVILILLAGFGYLLFRIIT
jgi:hypothetical protein